MEIYEQELHGLPLHEQIGLIQISIFKCIGEMANSLEQEGFLQLLRKFNLMYSRILCACVLATQGEKLKFSETRLMIECELKQFFNFFAEVVEKKHKEKLKEMQ